MRNKCQLIKVFLSFSNTTYKICGGKTNTLKTTLNKTRQGKLCRAAYISKVIRKRNWQRLEERNLDGKLVKRSEKETPGLRN